MCNKLNTLLANLNDRPTHGPLVDEGLQALPNRDPSVYKHMLCFASCLGTHGIGVAELGEQQFPRRPRRVLGALAASGSQGHNILQCPRPCTLSPLSSPTHPPFPPTFPYFSPFSPVCPISPTFSGARRFAGTLPGALRLDPIGRVCVQYVTHSWQVCKCIMGALSSKCSP